MAPNTDRRNTRIAGVLYLIGFIAGILSIAPAADGPSYLTLVSIHSTQTLWAAFFQLIMTFAFLGIALCLFPILKQFNERLALGFLSFRIIATVFIFMGVIMLLLILKLSQTYVRAPSADLPALQHIGNLLRSCRDYVNHIAMISTVNIGGMMLYVLLFRSGLIPRWLSLWGFFGALLTIMASALVMFRVMDIITLEYILMNVPIATQELILAVWLIIKGFDPHILAIRKAAA